MVRINTKNILHLDSRTSLRIRLVQKHTRLPSRDGIMYYYYHHHLMSVSVRRVGTIVIRRPCKRDNSTASNIKRPFGMPSIPTGRTTITIDVAFGKIKARKTSISNNTRYCRARNQRAKRRCAGRVDKVESTRAVSHGKFNTISGPYGYANSGMSIMLGARVRTSPVSRSPGQSRPKPKIIMNICILYLSTR